MLTAFADGAVFGNRIGEAEPNVLALHGWGGTNAQMLGCVEGLDALTLDLPGFGASPVPPEAWGASQYADLLVPVLETFHAPPVVVGFSFGGRVAVCLAAKRPDLVRALVLTGAPLLRKSASPTKAPLAFRIAKVAHRFGLLSDERMEEERRKRGSADYRAATGIMRNVLVRVVNETYENELRALQCPVDFVFLLAMARRNAAWARNNGSVIVNVPHAKRPESTRIEYRAPDPATNPYLTFAAILMAGLVSSSFGRRTAMTSQISHHDHAR